MNAKKIKDSNDISSYYKGLYDMVDSLNTALRSNETFMEDNHSVEYGTLKRLLGEFVDELDYVAEGDGFDR